MAYLCLLIMDSIDVFPKMDELNANRNTDTAVPTGLERMKAKDTSANEGHLIPPLPVWHAPLQGFTEQIYRNLHHRICGGVEYYFSPFLRVEHGSVRPRDLRDLNDDSTHRLIPQVLTDNASDLHLLVEAVASLGFRHVNLNFGCSFPLIARKGKGAGILARPDAVRALFDALKDHPEVSASVKMRLGWASPQEAFDLLPLINDSSVSTVILHPRLGCEQYKNPCNSELFARFASQCTKPIVFNGDIRSADEIRQLYDRFPHLRAVMIGRGILADPLLPASWSAPDSVSDTSRLSIIASFLRELTSLMQDRYEGDRQALSHLQPYWEYLLPETEKRLRKRILKAHSMADYRQAVRSLLQSLQTS